MREALSKDRKKDAGGGEDQWLIKPANAWGLEGAAGECRCAPCMDGSVHPQLALSGLTGM